MPLLVFDHRPAFLRREEGDLSLLLLPLGAFRFLDVLRRSLTAVGVERVLVLPTFAVSDEYVNALRRSESGDVDVVTPDSLDEALDNCEAGDLLWVADAARWPVEGFEVAGPGDPERPYRGAMHWIALGNGSPRARETVERDERGFIRRVQRLYGQVSWPDAGNSGVFLSQVPARTVMQMPFRSLPELRGRLVVQGVLCRDVPVPSEVLDLGTEAGYLALTEWVLSQLDGRQLVPGFTWHSPGVRVGRECCIEPDVRFVGPVVVHDRARLEAGATVVGPAVIGPGSHVGRNAIVAQSVLAADTFVLAGASVRHCVAWGRCLTSLEGEAGAADASMGILSGLHGDLSTLAGTGEEPTDRRRAVQFAIKRAVDVVVSGTALLLLAPFFALVAILVKLDSRGPVFFCHRRESRGGKEFPCIKFRSMVADAHRLQRALYAQNEVDGPQFKLKRDPRVSRMGRLMRATNVDELPQLINVFLGHMSLVGPRPSPFRENQVCVSWRRARLSVRPGITGLWQVCRSDDRSGGDFHEWIYYDIAYVRHFSLWLDFRIVIATITTLGGKWSVPLEKLIRTPHGPAVRSDGRAIA
ncbi:MAG: sugar transferase [Phycisphaerae bacterium]|nr:sugar transferase [Phycisphaerae bacterium]